MAIQSVTEGWTPNENSKTVLLFTAEWHDAHLKCVELLKVLQQSSDEPSSILFAQCLAEDCPELSQKYNVQSVPTFVLIMKNGQVLESIVGDQPAALTQAVARLKQQTTTTPSTERQPTAPSTQDALHQRIDSLIKSSDVMLFMKGTPEAPRCGFSRQMVELLDGASIGFGSFDILSDDAVRQGLKAYKDWPTYPQLYVHGELVGGLDIVKEMKEDDEDLAAQLGVSKVQSLNDRLKSLINQSDVMLFMKGLPSGPRCGFSRQMVELLESYQIPYEAFDILSDETVRQGLKAYSDWPTYPQLYVHGELMGGLDIVKEMHEDGTLKETFVSDQ